MRNEPSCSIRETIAVEQRAGGPRELLGAMPETTGILAAVFRVDHIECWIYLRGGYMKVYGQAD